uniref:Uncharacterized protein n=1 Tax=Anguilla anguilla TaxID=7936 RepID=A0A0E9XRW2_ANGAN
MMEKKVNVLLVSVLHRSQIFIKFILSSNVKHARNMRYKKPRTYGN